MARILLKLNEDEISELTEKTDGGKYERTD